MGLFQFISVEEYNDLLFLWAIMESKENYNEVNGKFKSIYESTQGKIKSSGTLSQNI